MYVGLFGYSAVVCHGFMFFKKFFTFYWLFVWLCFFQWHFIDLFSCIAASLFNKLTYLLWSASTLRMHIEREAPKCTWLRRTFFEVLSFPHSPFSNHQVWINRCISSFSLSVSTARVIRSLYTAHSLSKQVSAVANWPARQNRTVDRAWRSLR